MVATLLAQTGKDLAEEFITFNNSGGEAINAAIRFLLTLVLGLLLGMALIVDKGIGKCERKVA